MSHLSHDEAEKQVAEGIATLRELFRIFSSTPTVDLSFPTSVSHVPDYSSDESKLRRYGDRVIGARCQHFVMLTTVKAFYNLQMYLLGVDNGNPLALPMAARSQLEIFAVAWHVFSIIESNEGVTGPNLATRMQRIDDALLMATYGTREDAVMDMYLKQDQSNLRPNTPRDAENFKARNVLSRIEKADKGSAYRHCRQDYDRLSDFLHPNSSQNLLFMRSSKNGKGFFQLGINGPLYVQRALKQTIPAMVNSTLEILQMVSHVPDPFRLETGGTSPS